MTIKKALCVFFLFALLISMYSCTEEPPTVEQGNSDTEPTATTATTTAASSTTTDDNAILYAGYSKVDITPTVFPIPFASTEATEVINNIYATVIAFSDGENKVLFITLDLQTSDDPLLSSTLGIANEFGIPKENVFVSATHNHTAPSYTKSHTNINIWLSEYAKSIRSAISEALQDLSESSLEIGSTSTKNYAFTRRYIMEDGSFGGTHVDNPCTVYRDYETEIDDSMQIIRLKRDQKKDILMVNWQAHPSTARALNPTSISADYISTFRSYTENNYDVLFAFYQGASANIVTTSKIKKDQIFDNYMKLGKGLSERLGETLSALTPVSGDKIQITSTVLEASVDHSTDHLKTKALEVKRETNAEKQSELCKKYGFQSKYEASAIIARTGYAEKETLSLTTISLGEIAFVSAPFEMFDSTGAYIKENSPFKMTFVCSSTNGSFGYMPCEDAFKNGGYEVYSTRFVKGTAEATANILLDMLEAQHKTKN